MPIRRSPAAAPFLAVFCVGLLAAAGFVAVPSRPAQAEMLLFQSPDLFKAVNKNDLALARAAVLKGEPPNPVDTQGRTPLMVAINNGSAEMVKLLLDYRAHVNAADKVGNTPLHYAAQTGDGEIIGLLTAKGAKVNQENKQGVTPLMTAARYGAAGAVERLLKAGARVDVADFTGRTALGWADEGRNSRVNTLLRNAGAK